MKMTFCNYTIVYSFPWMNRLTRRFFQHRKDLENFLYENSEHLQVYKIYYRDNFHNNISKNFKNFLNKQSLELSGVENENH